MSGHNEPYFSKKKALEQQWMLYYIHSFQHILWLFFLNDLTSHFFYFRIWKKNVRKNFQVNKTKHIHRRVQKMVKKDGLCWESIVTTWIPYVPYKYTYIEEDLISIFYHPRVISLFFSFQPYKHNLFYKKMRLDEIKCQRGFKKDFALMYI